MKIHLKIISEVSLPLQLRFDGISQDPETKQYIMVLDYLRGGNLRDHLKSNFNNINWKRKLYYLCKLTSSLKKIHELDITHQDFHPGNILSHGFEYSSLFISDFGLSKLTGQSEKNPEKKQIIGVLPYIAPEVLSGEEYTKAADVYSFGIIVYEIVTGFAPYYDKPHDRDLARQICDGLRPSIPIHFPKLITRMIMRCWDARATHRPTFEELDDELWKYYWDYVENHFNNDNEITIQIKHTEKLSRNKERRVFGKLIRINNPKSPTNSTTTPMNYKTQLFEPSKT